jgi:hypothetical protein
MGGFRFSCDGPLPSTFDLRKLCFKLKHATCVQGNEINIQKDDRVKECEVVGVVSLKRQSDGPVGVVSRVARCHRPIPRLGAVPSAVAPHLAPVRVGRVGPVRAWRGV